MSARYAGTHCMRRLVVISSDNDTPRFDELPPSDPPEYETENEETLVATTDENPFLSSDDIPLERYVLQSSDDIPLDRYILPSSDDGPSNQHTLPSSEDIPLASRFPSYRTTTRRLRSSSLPTPVLDRAVEPSSEDVLLSPNTERKHIKRLITEKRLATYERNKQAKLTKAEEERMRKQHEQEILFDDVLNTFQKAGISLADFLHYVFKPTTEHVFDWKWRGFFRHQETVKEIFQYWMTTDYSKSARTFVSDWVIEQAQKIISSEANAISNSKLLRKTNSLVDQNFFLDFSLEKITSRLRELAPSAFALFDAFSTTKRQKRELKEKSRRKQELVQGSAILALLRSRSQNNNYGQLVVGTYLTATGAQRQHFTVFEALGISTSYHSVIAHPKSKTKKDASGTLQEGEELTKAKKEKNRSPGTLHLLSQACRQTARDIASTNLFITVYDNINMMIKVAEQVVGRKNAQENGTCATIVPLHNASLDDLETKHLDNGVMNAPRLKLEDLQLTDNEAELAQEALIHTILSIVIRYGGEEFQHWREDLEKNKPQSEDVVAVHQSSLHPLPSMEIDENTITGNIQIIQEINAELRLDPEKPDYQKYIKFVAGDQLTIARQRAITGVRLGHEVGLEMWKHFVLVTGLFHAKIADTHGTLLTHFGVSSINSPGSLAFHNSCLHRSPIVLTSLPSFRVCRDLIMVSLYARILHCLLLVSGKESLATYAKEVSTWAQLKDDARQILQKYANADEVQELREPRLKAHRRTDAQEKAKKKKKQATDKGGVSSSDIHGPTPKDSLPTKDQGDMVYENACLFLRDALLTRLFADAVKSGDSGLVIVVLKHWVFSYRGNGRTKYAHELLHLFHNLVNVWTAEIRKVVTQNWLLNPTGRANAFVEIDLVQEHLNFWIKRVYKAEGGSHSWDWLALVSPCVDILRKLSTKINHELGTEQGSKHTVPDLQKDIEILMGVLKEHDVYQIVSGRVVDAKDRAVPDVISVGLAQLSHGNPTSPIAEFNEQFERLRERRKLTPVYESDSELDFPELALADHANSEDSPVENALINRITDEEYENLPGNEGSDVDSEESIIADEDQDNLEIDDAELVSALMDAQSLELVDEADVALDMDGWDEVSDGNEDEESEEEVEEDGE